MVAINTQKDGSGDFYWPLSDSDGRQIIVGAAAHDAAAAGSPLRIAGVYRSSAPAVTSGDIVDMLMDAGGRQIIVGAAAEDSTAAGNPILVGGRYDSTPRDLDDGDAGAIALDADARVLVNSGWLASVQAEESTSDSDKEIEVSTGKEWEIQSIWIEYIADANTGARQVEIEIQDASDDVVAEFRAGATQAESETRYYLFAPHVGDLTSFRDTDLLTTPIPSIVLPAGYDVRVYDNNAISTAGDSMVVQMMVKERTV